VMNSKKLKRSIKANEFDILTPLGKCQTIKKRRGTCVSQ